MLYTFISDDEHRGLVWDDEQITSIVGNSDTGAKIEDRIDIWRGPKCFTTLYKEPLRVSFPALTKEDLLKPVPDICAVQGRLFMSLSAYKTLKPLIENDGEFLPLVYEKGEAYFFNPLRTAEEVSALDIALSRKNEWGDLENLAFYEHKLREITVFRTEYNGYYTLQGQQIVKEKIEATGLKGLYITPELGRIFPVKRNNIN